MPLPFPIWCASRKRGEFSKLTGKASAAGKPTHSQARRGSYRSNIETNSQTIRSYSTCNYLLKSLPCHYKSLSAPCTINIKENRKNAVDQRILGRRATQLGLHFHGTVAVVFFRKKFMIQCLVIPRLSTDIDMIVKSQSDRQKMFEKKVLTSD